MTLTNSQRETITQISQQQILGNGMWMNPEEFAQWACKEYGITRKEMTEWKRELMSGD